MIPHQWLVHYNAKTNTSTEILERLLLFQKEGKITTAEELHFLDFSGSIQTPLYREGKVGDFQDSLSPLLFDRPPLHRIGLFHPVLATDKRWQTIHLTSSAIFLGSALKDRGYEVLTGQQILSAGGPEKDMLSCHMVGFTLFEDLFLPFLDFLKSWAASSPGLPLLAAGGPLVTLNPLETACFLPELNLLVRGEGEFIFPQLLDALQENSLPKLFGLNGFLLNLPGWLLLSNLQTINRPTSLEAFSFNPDFLEPQHLGEGLEINLSRGCNRGCVFCSAVQGKTLRQLPLPAVQNLLVSFSKRVEQYQITNPRARTVNINDDDILQDPDYAARIFSLLQQQGFRLWGVQTSLSSLLDPHQQIRESLINLLATPELYMDHNPLVWLGTDSFLKERGKRMAKAIPTEKRLFQLLEALDEREINHYHYWISSDHLSTWSEFLAEFSLIYRIYQEFPYFGLLPHAPFMVPYPSTPLYRWLLQSPESANRVKYKKVLRTPGKYLSLALVDRVETAFPFLNLLLNNDKPDQQHGFFDFLHDKDYWNAFLTVYHYLKQERMAVEASLHLPENKNLALQLQKTQWELEEFLGNQM